MKVIIYLIIVAILLAILVIVNKKQEVAAFLKKITSEETDRSIDKPKPKVSQKSETNSSMDKFFVNTESTIKSFAKGFMILGCVRIGLLAVVIIIFFIICCFEAGDRWATYGIIGCLVGGPILLVLNFFLFQFISTVIYSWGEVVENSKKIKDKIEDNNK